MRSWLHDTHFPELSGGRRKLIRKVFLTVFKFYILEILFFLDAEIEESSENESEAEKHSSDIDSAETSD